MKTKTDNKVETTETVPTPVPVAPIKPNWGNPFHNQQRFSNRNIGGKRGFSGASRKGGMSGGK